MTTHEHQRHLIAHSPEVERIEVIRVSFHRGLGCCEESPVRIVTAYYDLDGNRLVEIDPVTA